MENFALRKKKSYIIKEGKGFLKTKNNNYKDYALRLMGSELYFYRNQTDANHEFMHSMVGSYAEVKENKQITIDHKPVSAAPLKLLVGPQKARVIYFLSKKMADDWYASIKEASYYANLFDYYEFIKDLGQGQFGVVKLGVHKMTGK